MICRFYVVFKINSNKLYKGDGDDDGSGMGMKTKGNSRYNLTLQLYFPFSLWFAYWLCGSVRSASLKVHKFKGKVKANTIKKECCVFFSLKSPSQSHECRYNTQSDFSGMKVITCLPIYLFMYLRYIHSFWK